MSEKGQPILRPKAFRPAEIVLLLILFGFLAAAFLHRHEFRSFAFSQRSARPTGTLSGIVLAADGKPSAGARVMAQTSDGRSPHAAIADANGRFRWKNLRVGPYDLRARADSTWSDWTRQILVRTNQDTSVKLRIPEENATPVKSAAPEKSPPQPQEKPAEIHDDKSGPDAAP